METQISSIRYKTQFLLREDGQVYSELHFEYPLNMTPLIPQVGEIFEHSKISYTITLVNHALFREDHDGAYTHHILIFADVKNKK